MLRIKGDRRMYVLDLSFISGCMLGVELDIPDKERADPEHPRYKGYFWSFVIDLFIVRFIVQRF